MRIVLIRREYITHLDGVNRFIALLAEGLRRLGHEVEIFSWCYRGIDRERLEEWFKEIHGLDICGGVSILTTPNIASLFSRLRLLLGKQPIYHYHVREYTMREVVSLLREAGFEVIKAYYSIV
jgi:hypothetical protein